MMHPIGKKEVDSGPAMPLWIFPPVSLYTSRLSLEFKELTIPWANSSTVLKSFISVPTFVA
eukprot:5800567-Pyramimonas_sp.AAC.1